MGAGPVQLFVTPDSRYLLVANQGVADKPSTTVSVIDTATFSDVATIETDQGANGWAAPSTTWFEWRQNAVGTAMYRCDYGG